MHIYDPTIRLGALYAASPHGSRMVTLVSRIVTICYHPYHRYDSTIRLGAPLCCLTTWFTDGKLGFTDRHHILPSVPSVRFDHTIKAPLCCLTTWFTDGNLGFTDRHHILPSVPYLPMVINGFTKSTIRYIS